MRGEELLAEGPALPVRYWFVCNINERTETILQDLNVDKCSSSFLCLNNPGLHQSAVVSTDLRRLLRYLPAGHDLH